MSLKQAQKVRALPKGACSRAERNMLKELADIADDNGERIFPGVAHLARRLHCTPRWVWLLVKKLRARGWVELVRSGGGTSSNGKRGRRNIYRLAVPTIINAQRELPGFPQGFPQNVHNPDLSISVHSDRSISVHSDLSITKAPDQTVDGARSSAVEIEPIRPVLRTSSTTKTDPSSTEKSALALTEDEQTDRARLEGLARVRMLKAQLLSTPTPARRRRHGR